MKKRKKKSEHNAYTYTYRGRTMQCHWWDSIWCVDWIMYMRATLNLIVAQFWIHHIVWWSMRTVCVYVCVCTAQIISDEWKEKDRDWSFHPYGSINFNSFDLAFCFIVSFSFLSLFVETNTVSLVCVHRYCDHHFAISFYSLLWHEFWHSVPFVNPFTTQMNGVSLFFFFGASLLFFLLFFLSRFNVGHENFIHKISVYELGWCGNQLLQFIWRKWTNWNEKKMPHALFVWRSFN